MKVLFACLLVFTIAFVGLAKDTPFKINTQHELEDAFDELIVIYEDEDEEADEEEKKRLYKKMHRRRELKNALRDYFNRAPSSFSTLSQDNVLTFFRRDNIPETRKADRVFCELVRKFTKDIDSKMEQKHLLFQFIAGNCAGSKYTLDLINYTLKLSGPDLNKLNKKELPDARGRKWRTYYQDVIAKVEDHVAMYNGIHKLKHNSLVGWKAYLSNGYLPLHEIGTEYRRMEHKVFQSDYKKDLELKALKNALPKAQMDEELRKAEILKNKQLKAVEFSLPELYRDLSDAEIDTVVFLALFPKFIERYKKNIDFDCFSVLKSISNQGGQVEFHDYHPIHKFTDDKNLQILIEDEKGKIQYVLLLPDTQNMFFYSNKIILVQFLYDNVNHLPIGITASHVHIRSAELLANIQKYILPLLKKNKSKR